jgi:hypothetical protein
MMVARLDGEDIEAARELKHRLDYRCPSCGSPVVLHARSDGWVTPHFKHKVSGSCLHAKGETPGHRAVKRLLCEHYRTKGLQVELERRVGTRRADVFVADLQAAFEVEFSPKESREFLDKCGDYARASVRSVWVLKQKNVASMDICVGNKILISTCPVLNSLASKNKPYGASAAFFIFDEKAAVVFRGELSPLMLYKEYHEYSGAGGYEYPSRSRAWLLIAKVIRT